jgi:hypothetical protein
MQRQNSIILGGDFERASQYLGAYLSPVKTKKKEQWPISWKKMKIL